MSSEAGDVPPPPATAPAPLRHVQDGPQGHLQAKIQGTDGNTVLTLAPTALSLHAPLAASHWVHPEGGGLGAFRRMGAGCIAGGGGRGLTCPMRDLMRGVAPPLMAEVSPEESAARDRAARGSRGPSPGTPPGEAAGGRPRTAGTWRNSTAAPAAAPALSPNAEGRFLGAVGRTPLWGS